MFRIKLTINKFLRYFGYQLSKVKEGIPIDLFSDLLKSEKDKMIFFDVGGHYGETVDSLIRIDDSATIFSFEPNLSSFQILKNRFKNFDRVLCNNMALGDTIGEMELLNYEGMDAINSFKKLDFRSTNNWPLMYGDVKPISVHITTLDNYCDTNGIDKIDLLKIDVQGFELEVLSGGVQLLKTKRIKFIYVELMPTPLYENQSTSSEVISWLSNYGYELVGLNDVYRFKNGTVRQFDALFKLGENE